MREVIRTRLDESIDFTALGAYLSETLGKSVGEISIEQFPSGASNLTYAIRFSNKEFVLRRPPFGNQVKSAHDMSREFRLLEKLHPIFPAAPKPLLYCSDEELIGSEFYLMESKKGAIIRGTPSEEFSEEIREKFAISQDFRVSICRSFIKTLAELHQLDYGIAGLKELGKPTGYTKRQVEGWSERYLRARTSEFVELEKVSNWLLEHIPSDDVPCLVHNDYKFDNIMLAFDNPKNVVGVLDWELATIGSPLLDLGTTLGYWMSADVDREMLLMPFNPRVLMENVSRREIADLYRSYSNLRLPNLVYYYIFGTFKIAAIAQQIFFRYSKGFTNDRRFSRFERLVEQLGKIALSAIEKDSI